MENIIIKFTADTEGLKPAIDQLTLMGKLSEEDAKKIQAINDSQKQYLQTLNATTTEAGKFNDEIKELEKIIKTEVLSDMADAMQEYSAEAEGAATKTVSLKKELKELKAQIASGQFEGKELQQMTRRAAQLEDKIGDVNQQIRALASDTKRIDAAVTAFRGLAAAGSVAAGATALLGKENEDLQKTLVKVQSAMALLNGVQELANILTAESALKTLFLDGAQKAATVSSRILGVTITQSMAAATMGLSLVVAAIAAIVVSMNDAEDEANAATDRLIERLQNQAKVLGKATDLRISLIKDGRKRELAEEDITYNRQVLEYKKMLRHKEIDTDTYIEIIQSLNLKHNEDILAINEKYDKIEADKRKKELEEIQRIEAAKRRARELMFDEFRSLKMVEIEERLKDLSLDKVKNFEQIHHLQEVLLGMKLTELRNELAVVESRKLAEKSQEKRNQLTEQEIKLKQDILRLEAEISRQSQQYLAEQNQRLLITKQTQSAILEGQANFDKAQIEAAKKFNMDREALMEEYYDMNAKLAEDDFVSFDDFVNKKIESLKKLEAHQQAVRSAALDSFQSISDAMFQITANRLQAETDLQLEALNNERESTLRNKNLTEEQRAKIDERFRQQEAAIKRQAWERQKGADIASAIIATALAVTRALPSIPLSVAAGIAGAAQVAVIASQPTPRFAEGTEYFIGKGTGTSDHNLAWLSSGERVVSARTNADYFSALSAIHNREIEPGLANNVMEALKTMDLTLAPQYSKPQAQDKALDPIELAQILERNRTQVSINLDEQGFTKHIRKSTTTTNYRNAKFRINA